MSWRATAFCLAMACPAQALALSCLPWHVEDAFREADASAETYVIVTGTLDFDARDLPEVDWARQSEVPPETRLDAHLTGSLLGKSGERTAFDAPLEIIVECAGPWCPQLAPGASYLAFVNTERTPYRLRVGACGGMAFQDPGPDMLHRVQGCLDGDSCTPPER